MKSYTQDGVLVLADISGFTEFVTSTELEHGAQIIAALLETVIQRLSPPLEIQEVEGDAVFALGSDGALLSRDRLLDVFDRAFASFKALQAEMAADRSCACGACSSAGNLDLKIVAHHGRFLRQAVGGHSKVAGVDVILAHRLLKNGVTDKRAYLLLTEAMLGWLGLDPDDARLDRRVESYEHLGDVRCFVRDLPAPAEGREMEAIAAA
jgi:hypothetical protein